MRAAYYDDDAILVIGLSDKPIAREVSQDMEHPCPLGRRWKLGGRGRSGWARKCGAPLVDVARGRCDLAIATNSWVN